MPETDEKIYRLRYTWKPVHHCPTCACEPRETTETSNRKQDLEKTLDRILSREASASMEVLEWRVEEAPLVWEETYF